MQVLTSSADFKRLSVHGQKWITPSFIVLVAPRHDLPCRVGFTVSRKIGGAVARNRVKRRLRETVRSVLNATTGFDVVLIARATAKEPPFADLARDLRWALQRLGIAA